MGWTHHPKKRHLENKNNGLVTNDWERKGSGVDKEKKRWRDDIMV